MNAPLIALLTAALSAPLAAQWLNHPTPGIPRTPDGKPNLTAPAPRTPDGKPDLSGLWTKISPKYSRNIAADLKPEDIQSWAQTLVEQRKEDLGKEYMNVRCVPLGPGYATSADSTGAEMMKIVQTPGLILILNPDLTYRQIFLDGRALESAPNPSWMGYSVGRWDGDTLVVNSVGFNDKTWLNDAGLPHTEALRVTERYRRRDVGHLEMEVTYTDPATYAKPWGFSANMALAADTEMLEAVCERSSEHWTGNVSDAATTAVTVAPDMLARYVGVYTGVWGGNKRTVEVSLSGGKLIAKIPGGTIAGDDSRPLVPLSQTLFEGLGLGYRFIVDDHGVATDVVEIHISGPYRYPRQP